MFRRILGMLSVLIVAAAVYLYVHFQPIDVGKSAAPQVVTVQPKQPSLICPGPVFVNGGDNGVTLGSFTQSGTVMIFGQNAGKQILETYSRERELTGLTPGSKTFNAIQVQSPNTKLAFGLSAANCVPGSNNGWLVAGDNSVGREALLVLANPTSVDATVSLHLYGTSGLIQGSGLSGISAPAGKVTVLPLSAFAPKAETFSIQVSSRGAELGIWLQQKTVRGLTPGGLDLIGLAAEPNKVQDIPGVFLRGTTAITKLSIEDTDFNDTKPILRVTVPGDKAANFTAQVQGADGSSFGNVIQGTVPAGSTRDFPLEDLADGNYSVHLTSDIPVVAASRFSRISGSKPDFTWAQAVAPSKLNAGFTTASGATTKLSIVNGNESPAQAILNGRTLTIPANSNLVFNLAAGTNYKLSSNLQISASQVVDFHGGIANLPVLDYRSVGGTLKITVR